MWVNDSGTITLSRALRELVCDNIYRVWYQDVDALYDDVSAMNISDCQGWVWKEQHIFRVGLIKGGVSLI